MHVGGDRAAGYSEGGCHRSGGLQLLQMHHGSATHGRIRLLRLKQREGENDGEWGDCVWCTWPTWVSSIHHVGDVHAGPRQPEAAHLVQRVQDTLVHGGVRSSVVVAWASGVYVN
jgi:hypothetical protein